MCGAYGTGWALSLVWLVLFAVLVVAGVVFIVREPGRRPDKREQK